MQAENQTERELTEMLTAKELLEYQVKQLIQILEQEGLL